MLTFPGVIRPQALIFARFPRTLGPATPGWNPASSAHGCTLRARPLTRSPRVESGLKRSFLHASRAPSDPQPKHTLRPQLPARIRPKRSVGTLPVHPPTPNPRTPADPQNAVKKGF